MNFQVSSKPMQLEPTVTTFESICDFHGAFGVNMVAPWPGANPRPTGCPTCKNEMIEREAKLKAERRVADRKDAQERKFRNSCIPQRFSASALDNYHASTAGQKRALHASRRFVETILNGDASGASLVLVGGCGTGKTHLACAVGHALTNELRNVIFATVLGAVRHIKETYRKGSERSEGDAIADFIEPDLLILDEIGVQIGSEHEKMLVFEIINERYQECKSTILISNLNTDELTAYLGERVMDRFRETGAVIAFDWASHRGKGAKC